MDTAPPTLVDGREPSPAGLEPAAPAVPAGGEALVLARSAREGEAWTAVLESLGRRARAQAPDPFPLESLEDPALRVALVDDALPRALKHAVLEKARHARPDLDVVLVVAPDDVAAVVDGMRRGAADCLERPLDPAELARSLAVLAEARALERGIAALKEIEGVSGAPRILGGSRGLRRALELARRAAPYPVSVLLLGESGTGKECFAAWLHQWSPRARGPFVSVDCAAIPADLVESELFGHVRGAFTGAQGARAGRLEEAEGGTLFLDEVGNLPPATQMKLLRVLQERVVYRLGSREGVPLDVRVVAATNGNLRGAMAQGTFREDLYHRMAEFVVELPPLREREGDVDLLAAHFLESFNRRFGRRVAGFTPQALERLRRHPWPGNVRELQSAIKRAVILAGDRIGVEHLPEDLGQVPWFEVAKPEAPGPPAYHMPEGVVPLWVLGRTVTEEVEKRAIEAALRRSGGDKPKAAALLDIHFKTLYRKMKEYNLA